MLLPNDIKIYGNTEYRGTCPKETLEQVTFFSRLRRQYPDTLGLIAFHVRNEGKRNHLQAAKEKSEGMTTGAADIIIPGAPTFVCELKRRDHTQSSISDQQVAELSRSMTEVGFAERAMYDLLGVTALTVAGHAQKAAPVGGRGTRQVAVLSAGPFREVMKWRMRRRSESSWGANQTWP